MSRRRSSRMVGSARYFAATAALSLLFLYTFTAAAVAADTTPPSGAVVVRYATAVSAAQDGSDKSLTDTKCMSCHSNDRKIQNAGYTSYSAWKSSVSSMSGEAGGLTATEIARIAGYLNRIYGSGADDPGTNSTGVVLYTRYSDSGGTGISQMRFSNDGVFDDTSGAEQWRPIGWRTDWDLPVGDGSKTVRVQFRDGAGNVSSPASDSIVLDTVAPSAWRSAPAVSVYQTKSTSFTVRWGGSDPAPSAGIAGYDVQYKVGIGGTWKSWKSNTPATSATFYGASGNTYYFLVRTRDKATNVSDLTAEVRTVVPYNQSSGRFSSYWYSYSTVYAYLSSTKYTTRNGAWSSLYFKGSSVSLVISKGPKKGKAKVYINGVYRKTIDSYASTNKYRQVVYIGEVNPNAYSTVKVVNLATYGRPRFDLDGFAVTK